VRTGLMILSCVLHGAVVTAALGLGVYSGRRLQAPAPLVQIATSLPSPPAAAPAAVELPVVVVEAVHEPEVESPDPDEQVAPQLSTDLTPRRDPLLPSRERVRAPRRPPEPVTTTSETPPAAEPAPAAAESLPDVEAEPRADNEPPRYPEEARRRGQEGTVIVLAAVAVDGLVLEVALQSPSPHPELNREALRAVRRWRFEPARRGGVAVAVTTPVSVVFRLQDPR
jgi:protein TonB